MLVFLIATQLLTGNMTQEDIAKTGLSKLSDKEKIALQTWIDSHFIKKSMKKRHPTPSLQENLKNGHLIGLTDGSFWEINPSDTPITQGWISAAEIKIEPSELPAYPYKLTNSLTGSSVLALKK